MYGGLNNSATETIHFEHLGSDNSTPDGAQDGQSSVTNAAARYDFIAQASGTYRIYVTAAASGKPYFHRIVRTPAALVSNVPAAPVITVSAGDAQAALQWGNVTGATYYNVKRGTTSGTYTTVASNLTGTSYTDSGLTNGTKYYYVMTASNTSGESALSNEVDVTPTATKPDAPTALSARPGDTQASLTWNASTGAASYTVKRGTTSGTYTTVAGSLTGLSYTDIGLTNGTKYFYIVTASNTAGESNPSNEVNVTPAAPVADSTNPGFTSEDIGAVGIPGSVAYNSPANEFTVKGAGVISTFATLNDLDSLHFVGLSSKLSGDGTIIAKVRSFDTGGASNVVLGLQVRTSLGANSNNAGVIIKPTASSNGSATSYIPYYAYRDLSQNKNTNSTGATAVNTAADGSFYLKLAYQGSTIATGDTTTSAKYRSYIGQVDGSGNIQWTVAKATSTPSAVSNSYYIGMFVASNDPTKAVTVNYDNVTIENSYDIATSTPLSALDGMAAPTWAGKGKVTPVVSANGDVSLSWNAAFDNFSVAKYNIYQGSNLIASTANGSTTTFTVTKAMVNGIDPTYDPTTKAYMFTIQAVDAVGNVSADGPSTSSDIIVPTWTSGNVNAPSVTQNSVTLTWSGASDNTGVTNYKVYNVTDSANPSLVATVDGNTTSYTVRKLNSSTPYVFKVEAGDSSNNWSTNGPTQSVTTTAPIVDTEAPTWLAGQLTVSGISQTGLTLTWSHADDNVGVEEYYIYKGSSTTPIATLDSVHNTYVVTGLTPAASYTFTVQAMDEAGNISKNGPSQSVSTPAGPSWPAAALALSNMITAQPNNTGPVYKAVLKDSVTLTWSGASDPIGVTGYKIYQKGITNPIATVDGTTDSYTVVGLTPGVSYTFKVEAMDNAGVLSTDGPSSDVTMALEDTTLLPPQNLSVPTLAYDDTSITLVWNKPDNYAEADIADYNVYMDGKKIGSAKNNSASPAKAFVDNFYNDSSNSSAVKVSNHTYIVTGLAPSTTHAFTVRSVDSNGNESADSNTLTQATTATPEVFNVMNYGAVGDGKALDTASIQATIDATPSGGKVLIPAGKTFVSGSLWIKKSNITFQVDGTLKASDNAADFPYPDPTHRSAVKTYSLLNTDSGLENIRIVGTGIIDGNGWKQDAPDADGFPIAKTSNVGSVTTNGILAAAQFNLAKSWGFSDDDAYKTRSNLISASGVNKVYFGGGLSVVNPSQHTLSVSSTNVTLNGVKIMTYDVNNGDGIDMSGTGLIVINSVFDTGDDDINFAAGVGATAERNPSVQNIWIFNNFFRRGHGAVVAGSNTAAWIQNIIAEDNVMNGIGVGLRAKTGAGVGGGARNIVFRDTAMKNVSDGDQYPFEFTSAYPSSTNDPAPDMGRFKHIFVKNVSVDTSTKNAIFVSGTSDAPHEDIHFTNVSFNNTPATSINYLKNSSFINVVFTNVQKGVAPWVYTNTTNTLILNDTTAPSWNSGTLTSSNVTSNSLSLSWSSASDNVGVTAYQVYQGSKLVGSVAGNVYSYSVTGLAAQTGYTFTIQAGDAAGNWSANGPRSTVTTLTGGTAPAAPQSLTATAGNAQATLTWSSVTDATYYNVYRGTANSGPFTKVATSVPGATYTNTGLTNGTTYYYYVTANNTFGESSSSNVVNATPVAPPQAPSAPQGLTATGGNQLISLSWSAVSGATSYNVYQFSNNTYTKLGSVTNAVYTVGGLGSGTSYSYAVTAVNAVGESTYSSIASALTLSSSSSSSSSGGGGTSSPTSTVQATKDGAQVSSEPVKETVGGKTVSKVTIDSDTLGKVFDALKSGDSKKISIEVKSSESIAKVQLDANALLTGLKNAPNAVLSIKSNDVTYNLPAKALDIAGLAKQLGTDAGNVKLNIVIEKVTGPTADLISSKAAQAGLTLLSGAVDFSITAEGNGKTTTVSDFGNSYVPRSILLTQTVDSAQVTAVLYNPATGEMSFVPATFATVNGKTEVTIKRQGNSTYTVVKSSKTFDDIQGHWAKNEIELLASKLVIKGATDTSFAPDSNITRAEFAALLVRAFGFTEAAPAKFNDVPSSSWFASAVGTAVKAGLVEGFEDNTFKPNDKITREQMAVMITRAMKLAGKSEASDAKQLDKFTDSTSINAWAKDAVAQAAKAGIVNGATDTTFVPAANATRAEAAVMLKRLLTYAQFIN
ncbi:fibronectin type III domain-containing protein [Paenibacillus cremeus]|uniref:fibronectin type III domain-containing protein n=1 Tax=Paenibacillus cremeus TaxID=2163881 RepID=UPI001C977CE6|nr:fibronectin type III domain-containing protein [Paenibacillus cremeus]